MAFIEPMHRNKPNTTYLLAQMIFVRLSMTSLICIDSAYAVACHTYSTKPLQGRASADCLMNYYE